jgi:hypothetical protein
MMFRDGVIKAAAVIAVTALSAVTLGQPEDADTPAFVTVVTGGGAERVRGESSSRIDPAVFSLEQNGLGPGDGIRTVPDGTAIVMLPGASAVAYLEGSTELRVMQPSTPDRGVSVSLIVTKGRVSVVQKLDADRWLLVSAGPAEDKAVSYTLSKGCSLFVDAGAGGVSFAARRGDALYFSGPVPAGALVDASGKPIGTAGTALPQGQRISVQAPDKPVPDKDANIVVPGRHTDDTYSFGLVHSDQWLQRAEEGDFTPVRAATRGAPEVLMVEMEPSLAFDQPRPVSVAPSPRAAPSAVRTTASPAQNLIQSGVPGSVVAGQRYLRSRIIGNPGTVGTGALMVNRSARPPIRFGEN